MSKHVVTPVRSKITFPRLSLVNNALTRINLFKRGITACDSVFFQRHILSNMLSTLIYVTPGNFSSFYSLGPAARAPAMHRWHNEL